MRFALLLAGVLATAPAFAQSSAQYRVTFESAWSAQTHPVVYPGASAHYSPLIGATHATVGALWSPGGLASPGIEQMAETGGTSLLSGEIGSLQAAGEAGAEITGDALGSTPGTLQTQVSVTPQHPLVTVVTMLAPSPDWFVGTDGVDLRDGDGWVPALDVELHVWDAGTDSGPAYTSGNQDTQPREPIQLSDAPPFAGGNTRVGTMRFELLSVVGADEVPDAAFTVGPVVPTPARGRARLSVLAHNAGELTVDLVDVLGRTVATTRRTVAAGGVQIELPVEGLAPGSYAVRVRLGDAAVLRRLVLAR